MLSGFSNFKFIKGDTIEIFNYGNCKRDFTYVDDIVEGIIRVMSKAPEKKNGEDGLPIPPYAIYNIGNSNPEKDVSCKITKQLSNNETTNSFTFISPREKISQVLYIL